MVRVLQHFVLQIDHVLENVLLIEHNIPSQTSGQVCDVTSQANDIGGVVLDPRVAVLADDKVMAHRVCPRHIVELVGVDGVRQDVIAVDRLQSSLKTVGLGEDKRLKVLLVVDALESDAISADSLLTEPKLAILILQHLEEVTQVLNHGQILNACLTFVFSAKAGAETDKDH